MIDDLLKQPDGSIKEIDLGDELDNVEFEKKYEILTNLLKKISKGGSIRISGIDIAVLGVLINSSLVSIPDVNKFLKTSVDRMVNVERFLETQGFLITERRIIENGKYLLSARYKV